MMQARLYVLLSCLFLSLSLAPSWAGPDKPSKELKQARKSLKKNIKRMQQANHQLDQLKELLRIATRKKNNEDERREISERIEVARGQCMDLVERIRRADSDKAVEFLAQFALVIQDTDVYERLQDDMFHFEDEEAIAWMAETLKGDLEEGGRKRRKKKRGNEEMWKVRVLIARTFDGIDGDLVNEALALVISKGRHPAVVNACVKAAARKENNLVIAALIELLGKVEESGGWEYYSVRQTLTGLTGEDFFTQEKWNNWWTKVETGWDFTERGETREVATRERGAEEVPPTFFGSEIKSNRLIFVIDSSGSMRMTDQPKDGDLAGLGEADYRAMNPDEEPVRSMQRMERAKVETVSAIKNLQPTQRFNIIDFDSGTRRWRESMTAATPENKANAIEWVKGIEDAGGTYTDDALKDAFSDPEVDTIYLLTDGAPFKNIGSPAPMSEWEDEQHPVAGDTQIQFAEEMIAGILQFVRFENRFRDVKIYTFGMDGPGVWHKKWTQPRPVTLPTDERWLSVLSRFMRELAAIAGGEFKSI